MHAQYEWAVIWSTANVQQSHDADFIASVHLTKFDF